MGMGKEFFNINVNLKIKKYDTTSVPSIAEIDVASSGSSYERHLTIPLTTIGKNKRKCMKRKKDDLQKNQPK